LHKTNVIAKHRRQTSKKLHKRKETIVNKGNVHGDVRLGWSFSPQLVQYLDTARATEFCWKDPRTHYRMAQVLL